MGTLAIATATSAPADTAAAAAAIALVFGEIARLEQVMSSWRDDSELSRLNAAGSASCSEDLFAVLDSALAYARLTGGAFDPSIEPLNQAWDMRGAGREPSVAELEAALRHVGWAKLELRSDQRHARLSPSAALDLGGIGKGFALDRAAAALARAGVDHALINLGGEIKAIGAWTVEIADPQRRLEPVANLTLENAALSTSGQSERGVIAGGRHRGHILDPRTGRPVETRASVSVIGASATRTDALSTALLVMGRDAAASWAARHPDVGVLWMEPDGGGVRAWRWNLSGVEAAPGARVQWMNEDHGPLSNHGLTNNSRQPTAEPPGRNE